MPTLNRIQIIGYLGRDPETRYVPDGTPRCRFNVAVNEKVSSVAGSNRIKATTWFHVVTAGDLADTCNQSLRKGMMVFIEGRVRLREFAEEDSGERVWLEVVATGVEAINRTAQVEEATQPGEWNVAGGAA